LLEAMQEAQVTIEGAPRALPDPFIVVATQNPIEYEGTYPLPEAQLDRFMLKLDVPYPDAEAEARIVAAEHQGVNPADLERVRPTVEPGHIAAAREALDATTVSPELGQYVVELVRRTRDLPSVSLGASPRAGVHLLVAAKAAARLEGRDFAVPDDVIRMAAPVLRHRLLLSPEAELERYRVDDVIENAISAVPVPR
jgi:MoxR-like ATPase